MIGTEIVRKLLRAASNVTANDGSGGRFGTVQGGFDHLRSVSGASFVGTEDAGGYYEAATVESVLQEIGGALIFGKDLFLYYSSLMAAGSTVNIGCYGDSTTDGNQTTAWVANPTTGGEAVGSIDHEATAPNAWPAKLKTLLREMYSNNNINVWNAGYSGMRMDNGWAVRNYDVALTNNPAYGRPDLCFIGFGLNDILGAGSQIAAHRSETRKLCLKLLRAGTLPVLLTCDASFRNDPAVRDHKEASRQLDAAKIALAKELGIPLIDMGRELAAWMGANRDGYRWYVEQTDGLHFEDAGHAFKAGVIGKALFRDLIVVGSGGDFRIPTWDSRAAYVGDYTTAYQLANLDQGANIVATTATPGQVLMRLWVWNASPSTELIYRGIEDEDYTTAGATINSPPSVKVTEQIGKTSAAKVPMAVGFGADTPFRKSELPYRFGHIRYGLSKIEYLAGDIPNVFYGHFEFWQTPRQTQKFVNCLKNVGYYEKSFAGGAADAEFFDEFRDGSNVFGLWLGESAEIFADVSLPVETGVILTHASGWNGTTLGYGSRSLTLLFRHTDTSLRIYTATKKENGEFSFALLAQSAALTWGADNRRKVRVKISRSADNQLVDVYDGYGTGTPLINAVLPRTGRSAHFAGAVGGSYAGSLGSGVVAIHDLSMRRA